MLSAFDYIFVEGFFDLENCVDVAVENETEKRFEVPLSHRAIMPKYGVTWNDVEDYLGSTSLGIAKLLVVSRHGNSGHNEAIRIFGKAIFFRWLARLPAYTDPELTQKSGHDEAIKAGQLLSAIPESLQPAGFYSSPLRRCILTSLLIMAQLNVKVELNIMENLREWLGWNHKHASDNRSSKQEIQCLPQKWSKESHWDLQTSINFVQPFPAMDLMFNRNPLQETYVDLDERLRKALDYIFENDGNKSVHITLHNRNFHSFLRVIGRPRRKGYFDLASAATVVFVIKRDELSAEQFANRHAATTLLRTRQVVTIMAERDSLDRDAESRVRDLSDEYYYALLEALKDRSEAIKEIRRFRNLPLETVNGSMQKTLAS